MLRSGAGEAGSRTAARRSFRCQNSRDSGGPWQGKLASAPEYTAIVYTTPADTAPVYAVPGNAESRQGQLR